MIITSNTSAAAEKGKKRGSEEGRKGRGGTGREKRMKKKYMKERHAEQRELTPRRGLLQKYHCGKS